MKRLLLVFFILFTIIGLSDVVSYLTSKDGKIYEKYSIDSTTLTVEYVSYPEKTFFSKPKVEYSIIKNLVDFLIIKKYLDDKNITLDSTSIENNAKVLYKRYKNDPKVLKIYTSHESFFTYLKLQMWKNEVVNKVKDDFLKNIDSEKLKTYVQKNFSNIKDGYNRVKIKHIVVSSEASANNLIKKIKNKELSFEDAVKKYSMDKKTIDKNGEVGWIDKNTNDFEFSAAISLNASINEVVGPIMFKKSYEIIFVEDKVIIKTPEDILKDVFAVNKIKELIAKEDVASWFKKYRDNYDFTVYYKPLAIEYRVNKAKDFNEKVELEKTYREKLLNEKNIPNEWFISYDTLVKNILREKLSYLDDLTTYNNELAQYPEYFNKKKEDIEKDIAELKKIEATDDSTINVQKAMDKEDILNDILYFSEFYTFKTMDEIKGEITTTKKYVDELKTYQKQFLVKLYENNENTKDSLIIISTILKRYPKDAYIRFQYTKTLYKEIKESKQGNKELLTKTEKMFEDLLSEKSLDKKYIEEINTYIKEIKAGL